MRNLQGRSDHSNMFTTRLGTTEDCISFFKKEAHESYSARASTRLGSNLSNWSHDIQLRNRGEWKIALRNDRNSVLGGVANPVCKFFADQLGVSLEPVMYSSPDAYVQSFGKR